MQEKIGNVVLEYEYYPGEDFYSDGPVEEELLEMAKLHLDDYSMVISQKSSWSALYHFSKIRQNIIEWFPIEPCAQVLEIGSGCGAITGALAEKAEKVTCVELSKKRSYINAHRNHRYSNIEIIVGNFQDIEPNLSERYDYITLIGVFEYSRMYISSDRPFHDMLRKIRGHLKPGGKILLAIENRLGMKYWAGCTEDHNGRYFEGIEGYTHVSGARTFSKRELEGMFQEVGGLKAEFFYPYPDYKFSLAVYSDEYLPKRGELHNNLCNMDRQRLLLFDETRAYDSLVDEGQFPEFSNSFLVILEKVEI